MFCQRPASILLLNCYRFADDQQTFSYRLAKDQQAFPVVGAWGVASCAWGRLLVFLVPFAGMANAGLFAERYCCSDAVGLDTGEARQYELEDGEAENTSDA